MNTGRQWTTRREFLAAGAALGMSLSKASGTVAAEPNPLKGRVTKAVKWHMIDENLSELDKLKLIRDLGFDGAETHSSLRTPKVDIGKLAKASEKADVPVHGVINSSLPDIVTAIDDARRLNATSVLHVVRYDRSKPYLQNYKETQDIIRRAIPEAEKHEIQILIENVWASFLIEPLITARYVDEFKSPWVQIYFDVGNVVRWGWPEHWLQVIGSRAKKLDIKEFDLKIAMNEGMRKAFNVPLGSGSIDWPNVRKELIELDYRGWATAEVRGGDRERLKEISTQMDAVLGLT